jgi:hypothetical protein
VPVGSSRALTPHDVHQLLAEGRAVLERLRSLGQDAEADQLEDEIAEVERHLTTLQRAEAAARARSAPEAGVRSALPTA